MQVIDADRVLDFVIAGHGDLARVQELLFATPDLLDMAHEWEPGDTETAVQAAAHVGNPVIAVYLLSQGAENAIPTAAMLGDRETVEALLEVDPGAIHQHGAHGITLLAHAVFSGDVELVRMLIARGATAGSSHALTNAVSRGEVAMVKLLLNETAPDLTWKNYQGQSPLDVALALGYGDIGDLLREYGA